MYRRVGTTRLSTSETQCVAHPRHIISHHITSRHVTSHALLVAFAGGDRESEKPHERNGHAAHRASALV
jgi:hypothetical protein